MKANNKYNFKYIAVASVLTLSLWGCSGEGVSVSEQGANTATDTILLSEQDESSPLRAVSQLSDVEAVRLLNQATFGATDKTLADVKKRGLEGWIDWQFKLGKGQSHWARMNKVNWNNRGTPDGMYGVNPMREHVVHRTWQTYIQSKDQLRVRMAAALLEIFVINARVDVIGIRNNQNTASAFLDMLETNSFGNFEDILYRTSRHPAMGHYLSFHGNSKAVYDDEGEAIQVPDENYARELMQLFSIGLYELNNDGTLKLDSSGQPIETYTQDDVFNLARVFTGWGYDARGGTVDRYRRSLVSNNKKHSPEEKAFLGTVIPAKTAPGESLKIAIDTVFNHPNVGPFIGKQLIQKLVTSNPSPSYVERVTNAFNNNGKGVRGDMKAVIKAILLDEEARNPQDVYEVDAQVQGKVREPMMRLTAIARILSVTSKTNMYPITNLMDTSHGLGQSPFKSPSVFNFFRPGYTAPNSDIADRNLVSPEFQIVTGSAIPGSINLINDVVSTRDKVFKSNIKTMEGHAANAEALVSYLDLMLTSQTLEESDKALIVSVVNGISANDKRARIDAALQMIAASPAFLIQR